MPPFHGRHIQRLGTTHWRLVSEQGTHQTHLDWSFAQRQGSLNQVLQLAYVAGKLVRQKQLENLGLEPGSREPFAPAELLGEIPHHVGDVLSAFLERWQKNLHSFQSVVQILTEDPLRHQSVQISICGGDQTNIHRYCLVPTDSDHFPFLEGTEQLDLHRRPHVADLVQKKTATIGQLELAAPRLHSSRDAALNPKKLALEKRLRERTAIEGHERTASPRLEVQQLGHQLLASTAVASQDNTDVSRCHPLDKLQHPPHGVGVRYETLAADLVDQVVFERLVLLLQSLALRLEQLHLSGTVEGGASQYRYRLQEPSVFSGESDAITTALLFVQDCEITKVDATASQRSRQDLREGPIRKESVSLRQDLAAGQELAPQGGIEKSTAIRRSVTPADARHRPRAAIGIPRHGHSRPRVENCADPLQQFVHQLLLWAVCVESQSEIVERLELEDPALFCKRRSRRCHGVSVSDYTRRQG